LAQATALICSAITTYILFSGLHKSKKKKKLECCDNEHIYLVKALYFTKRLYTNIANYRKI